MSALRNVLLVGVLIFNALSVHAFPVEYRFTGALTGDIRSIFTSQTLLDTSFTLSIFANTDNVSTAGYIAGAGRGFTNNSSNAIWSVSGLGQVTSSSVQIYTLPGLGLIGFGWGGQTFPLNTDNPAQINLYFNGNSIAIDSNYSRLSTVVTPVAVNLLTALKNPPNRLPEYTTSIYFDSLGPLILKNLSNVSYSVLVVPEPSTFALLLVGLGVVTALVKRRNAVRY
jgi:hypothetical protein